MHLFGEHFFINYCLFNLTKPNYFVDILGNLIGEMQFAPHTTIEDTFIRKFMMGAWHDLFLSEVIIKRRQNMVIVAGFVRRVPQTRMLYFLKGFTEELLSHFLKRPVIVEIQTAGPRDLIHKYV